MIIENDGLPEAVYQLILDDDYSREGADISVTQLIDSPRVRVLTKINDSRIVVKASTRLAATLGKAFHKAVEKATLKGTPERRLSIGVNGWVLSGGMDHYQDGVISDYKTANVFKAVYAESGKIEEFENQLNVYAHILRSNDFPVTNLKIFVLFKDWNRRGFSENFKKGKIWVPWSNQGYPVTHWAHFSVPLWTKERASQYVLERVLLHQAADEKLPLCSREEVWKGIRCKEYCPANLWCDQFESSKKTGIIAPI